MFIGTFAARAEGSTTSYGPSPTADEHDWPMPNVDGQVMVTLGRRHFHEVSPWHDAARPRVTYAFDIVDPEHAARKQTKRILIPFDGPDFA